jgi:hypothetical protein
MDNKKPEQITIEEKLHICHVLPLHNEGIKVLGAFCPGKEWSSSAY